MEHYHFHHLKLSHQAIKNTMVLKQCLYIPKTLQFPLHLQHLIYLHQKGFLLLNSVEYCFFCIYASVYIVLLFLQSLFQIHALIEKFICFVLPTVAWHKAGFSNCSFRPVSCNRHEAIKIL